MSRTTANVNKNRFRALGLGVVGIAAAALLVSPSGADFSASDTGRVDVSTATLSLSLSDAKGSVGTFDLDFTNLKPGQTLTQNITVKNTGSIAANVKIGAPITGTSFSGGSLTATDYSELKVAIPGYQAQVAATAMPSTLNLGTLSAGETKTYPVQISLDQTAGNEWQGVTLGADATVTLAQS